jgi:beta-phosphoglucomutase family hydrolase
MHSLQAVIFDLDGTLIDNNAYHIEAWKSFYEKHKLSFSTEAYKNTINGKTNKDIFRILLGEGLTDEQISVYENEKEALYREKYFPHIKPVRGLLKLLQQLSEEKIPLSIATSGIWPNIHFMFENLPIQSYFQTVIDASQISCGKPHPEIFLKAASSLGVPSSCCVAFEDSLAGIQSAKAAGMYVVGLATTHSRDDLSTADHVINHYDEISVHWLRQFFQ